MLLLGMYTYIISVYRYNCLQTYKLNKNLIQAIATFLNFLYDHRQLFINMSQLWSEQISSSWEWFFIFYLWRLRENWFSCYLLLWSQIWWNDLNYLYMHLLIAHCPHNIFHAYIKFEFFLKDPSLFRSTILHNNM